MNVDQLIRRTAAAVCLVTIYTATSNADDPMLASPRQRGHYWVRNHPFTIAGLVRMTPQPFDVEQYRKANFSSLLAWEEGTYEQLLPTVSDAGLPFHLHLEHWGQEAANRPDSNEETLGNGLRELDSEPNQARLAKLIAHSGCVGFLVNDEAVRPTYLRYTRHLLQWLRKAHPQALAYSNAHPAGHEGIPGYLSLDDYLDEFAAMVEPDVLMTDVYPLGDPDGTAYNYFKILGAVRQTALAHGMPYWMFIQSFETHGSWDRRLPSESDLRFQMFAPLTYGYTGILYFTYDLAFERGLIEKSGEPNRLYYSAAEANPEVANVGAAIRFLTSTDVRYVQGNHLSENQRVQNSLPRDAKPWNTDAGGNVLLRSVQIDEDGEGKDALIGFFQDDQHQRYLMLTNLWHNADASALDRELGFTLRFASEVQQLYRLSRHTGATESVALENGVLRIRLPGGTGDLFKFTAGPFPGTAGLHKKMPRRVAISGRVIVDGKPLQNGSIVFRPTGATPGPISGGRISQGEFKIPARQGPSAGTFRVEISGLRATGRKVKDPNSGTELDEIEQILPKKYNKQSVLTVETVEGEKHQFDFDLTSD